MKVHDFYQKALAENISTYSISEVKVHSDADNNVRSIEVKYVPNDVVNSDIKVPPIPAWR